MRKKTPFSLKKKKKKKNPFHGRGKSSHTLPPLGCYALSHLPHVDKSWLPHCHWHNLGHMGPSPPPPPPPPIDLSKINYKRGGVKKKKSLPWEGETTPPPPPPRSFASLLHFGPSLFLKNRNYCHHSGYIIDLFVGALWCSGSCSRLVISGSWVRIPLGAYALRQGILSTICLSRPRCSKWVPGRNLFLEMLMSAYIGSSAKAGVIIH